jgi:hypothetical protein
MTFQIQPAYHRAFRWAFRLQILSIVLASLVLDFGIFAFHYFCVALVFWVTAGVLAVTYAQPPKILRVFLGIAPQLIFWLMFFFPWWT